MLEPPQTPRSKQATLFQTHPELHSARGAALKEQAVTQESPGATKGSGSSNLPGYDASVARVPGGNVNVILRSGGNQLHGSVQWFHTDQHLEGLSLFQRQFL